MSVGVTKFGIGQPVPRSEDPRLLTGRGRYTDDFKLAGMCHGYVLRAPHARAEIAGMDIAAAAAAPGVIAVLTGADASAEGLGDVQTQIRFPPNMGIALNEPPYPLLARGAVNHVGAPVAFVVAETLAQARDAAELIVVDYRELPAVVDASAALAGGAPQLYPDCPGNVCFHLTAGDKPGMEAGFAKADHVTELDIVNNRITTNAMEPRAAVGMFDPLTRRMTLYAGNQSPHQYRKQLAADIFHVPETDVRVICDEVGGGFGMRGAFFVENALVVWAARKTGRPVKWVADRSEGFMSDAMARDNRTRAALALDKDGKFLALRSSNVVNMGSAISTNGLVPAAFSVGCLAGTYTTPAIYAEVTGAFTNTVPTDAYRGAGRPEAIYILERLIDVAAREMGIDPAELRRRNLIPPDAMPYQTFVFKYDNGDFPRIMRTAMDNADYDGFAARRAESERRGKLRGIGLANYIERCGGTFNEYFEIRIDSTGAATIMCGTFSHGQGHETVFPQLLADFLGLAPGQVRLAQGDTDQVAFGRGTFGSRSAILGAGALRIVADKIIEKGKKIAGFMLEAAPEDIAFEDGTFTVAGTDRAVPLAAVAKMAYDIMPPGAPFEPGLTESTIYQAADMSFPNGCHVCEVEIDPETGTVDLVKYTVVDDFGLELNPLLLHGQVHGGIAQGAGQALQENIAYDESGQLLSGSFMDYAMPRADDLPSYEIATAPTPCVNNVMGVKGAGESGAIGALPAVINAITDALGKYGIHDIDMPATPERVWRAIQAAGRGSGLAPIL